MHRLLTLFQKCSVCLESRRSNTKEPMAESETPELPWLTVGTDIFYWNNNNYLIIVDYYSRYFEIAKLENIRASCVITHMKSVFARHGIPSKVRSDSGSQYVAAEFRQFAESWGFTHTVSSPHYQQSNGLAERFVQSVKKMLSKSKQDGQDPYIAMLKYRNTPLENLDSPAQLLMNRRFRTTIPTIKNRLKPKCGNLKNTQRKMKQQKMNQKQYYDKSSKPLPELQPNDTIRFQHIPKGKWDQGTVVRNNNTPNSYVIETPEGQIFKRNRKHLLKTKEDKIEQTSLEEANENNHNDFDNITAEQSLEPSFVRRSERSVTGVLALYDLPSITTLSQNLPSKLKWKATVKLAIQDYWTKTLIKEIETKSSLSYLDKTLLRIGSTHPVWTSLSSTVSDVKKGAIKVRLLTGTYLLDRSKFSGGRESALCKCCGTSDEDIIHFLLLCPALHQQRKETFSKLKSYVISVIGLGYWSKEFKGHSDLIRLIVDSSFLLPKLRNRTELDKIQRLATDMCYRLHSQRVWKLQGKY
ncbi:unnamed protein product [Mytilus coruscus]|uniref:Integrase catalytic domain-containing protein n=1 Tax=Mytilus coruscus TaxID=42192 RepID=A0A6J8DEW7_MYTCO|nr:unnamed protein product [Mytilus coruscus]